MGTARLLQRAGRCAKDTGGVPVARRYDALADGRKGAQA